MLRLKNGERKLAHALYRFSAGQPFRSGVYAALAQTDRSDRFHIDAWRRQGWWAQDRQWRDGAFTPQGIAHFTRVLHQQVITFDTVT